MKAKGLRKEMVLNRSVESKSILGKRLTRASMEKRMPNYDDVINASD